MKHRLPSWFLAVILLLLGFAIYLAVIPLTDMHSDEYLVYHQTRLDLGYTLWHQTYQDVHPPLWFSLFWGWRQLVGISEYAGRLHAILISLLTLAVTYRLGREWFSQAHTGLLAMALLLANGFHLAYALEIRPYALTMLLAALSMLLFSRWLRSEEGRGWRWALAWGVLAGVSLYVHYFIAFLYITQGLYALVVARPWRKLLREGGGAALVGIAIWLPWAPFFQGQVETLRGLALAAGTAYGTGLGTNATTSPTSLETIWRFILLLTNQQPLLYALLLLGSVVLVRRRAILGLAWVWFVLVVALALAGNVVAAVFSPRYYAYVTVGLALAAAAGIGTLKLRLRWTVGALVVLMVGLGLAQTLPDRPHLRDYFRIMSAQAGSDDTLYIDGEVEGQRDGLFDWQMRHYLVPELYERVIYDLNGDLPRRIWYLTDDWFDDDVQARFRVLEMTHPLQQVLGRCDRGWCFLAQLMEAPPLAEPIVFGDQLGFRGADITQVDGKLDLRLWWQNAAPIDRDYSIGVQVIDGNGALVAQSDGPINDYGRENVQTSQMTPGRIYVDERTLALPEGAADDLRLMLVVYQSWDGMRLRLADGRDALEISP
jgi:hypothetical protein